MLVFMGGFGVWTQVWSKGSCVGKVKPTPKFIDLKLNMLLWLSGRALPW